jgi:hypothetical protein
MNKDLEEKLKLEISHICDSGANEIRLLEMFKNFSNKYFFEKKTDSVIDYPNKVCKGSISLGTGCGNCSKCKKQILEYKIEILELKEELCPETYLPTSIYGRNEK